MTSQGLRVSLASLALCLACSAEPSKVAESGTEHAARAGDTTPPKPTSLEDWAPETETFIVLRKPGTLAASVDDAWLPPPAPRGPNPAPGSVSVDASGWLRIFASLHAAGLVNDDAEALLLVDRGAVVLRGSPQTLEPHFRAVAPWARCVWFKALDGYASCGVDGIPGSWPAPQTGLAARLEHGLTASAYPSAAIVGTLVRAGTRPIPFAAEFAEDRVSVVVGLGEAQAGGRPVFVPRVPELLSTIDPSNAFSWSSGDVAAVADLADLSDAPEATAILDAATGELLVGTPKRGQGIVLSLGLDSARDGQLIDASTFNAVASGLTGDVEGMRFEHTSATMDAGGQTASVHRIRASGAGVPAWIEDSGVTPQLEWIESADSFVVGVGLDAPARKSVLAAKAKPLTGLEPPSGVREALDEGRIAHLTSVPFGPLFSAPFSAWARSVPSLSSFPRLAWFPKADHLWVWLEIEDGRSVFRAELTLVSADTDPVRAALQASSTAWAKGDGLVEAYAALEKAVGTPVPATIASRIDARPAVIRDGIASVLVAIMGPGAPLLVVRGSGAG